MVGDLVLKVGRAMMQDRRIRPKSKPCWILEYSISVRGSFEVCHIDVERVLCRCIVDLTWHSWYLGYVTLSANVIGTSA